MDRAERTARSLNDRPPEHVDCDERVHLVLAAVREGVGNLPMPNWRDKPSYVHGWDTAKRHVLALLDTLTETE